MQLNQQPKKSPPSKKIFKLGCVVFVITWIPVAMFVGNPWLKTIGLLASLALFLFHVWISFMIIHFNLDDYLEERVEEDRRKRQKNKKKDE